MALAAGMVADGSVSSEAMVSAAEQVEVSPQSGVVSRPDMLQGSDGVARRIEDFDQDGLQGRRVFLSDGDRLEVKAGGTQVSLVNSDGDEVGVFSNPTVVQDGHSKPGVFSVVGDVVTVAPAGPQFRDACRKATVGKWTYRIGATGVCTAFGLGTSGLGGAACGLGASAAEDQINFDKVC